MKTIDLNSSIVQSESSTSVPRLLFGHEVKVCRNTNVVFSPYDDDGQNRLRIALLGVFKDG